jgi:putative endonuclease
MKTYYVYILASQKNGTLYIGMTNILERRIYEHKNKMVKSFTSKYDVNKLMYFEEYNSYQDAFEREYQLKKWKRAWKINLIEKDNPLWEDLSEGWFD